MCWRLPASCSRSDHVHVPVHLINQPTPTTMRPQLHDSPEARRNPDFSHIDVSERARAAVLTVTDRINHPHRGIGARLAVMMRDMVRLVELGATEAEMRAAYEVAVMGLIDDLFPVANAMDFA